MVIVEYESLSATQALQYATFKVNGSDNVILKMDCVR